MADKVNNPAGTNNAQNNAQQTTGTDNTNNAGGADNNNASGSGTGTENLSEFDKFLQGEGMQAEFDRRIAKALNTAKTKQEAETKTAIENAVAEALKVAKMTEDEKAEHEAEKRNAELTAREEAITKRELQAKAKETLIEKGLPVDLAETLSYTDSDSLNTSIEALAKAFQSSVQSAVEEKLKGTKPPGKANNNNNSTLTETIKDAMAKGFYG